MTTPTPTQRPTLAPCPVCGEEASFGDQLVGTPGERRAVPFVNCTGCLLALNVLMPDDVTEADLAAIWNRRPPMVVIESDVPLSDDDRARIAEAVAHAQRTGSALVLDRGLRVAGSASAALARIEAKVDAMAAALDELADEGDDDGTAGTATLDTPGRVAPHPATL